MDNNELNKLNELLKNEHKFQRKKEKERKNKNKSKKNKRIIKLTDKAVKELRKPLNISNMDNYSKTFNIKKFQMLNPVYIEYNKLQKKKNWKKILELFIKEKWEFEPKIKSIKGNNLTIDLVFRWYNNADFMTNFVEIIRNNLDDNKIIKNWLSEMNDELINKWMEGERVKKVVIVDSDDLRGIGVGVGKVKKKSSRRKRNNDFFKDNTKKNIEEETKSEDDDEDNKDVEDDEKDEDDEDSDEDEDEDEDNNYNKNANKKNKKNELKKIYDKLIGFINKKIKLENELNNFKLDANNDVDNNIYKIISHTKAINEYNKNVSEIKVHIKSKESLEKEYKKIESSNNYLRLFTNKIISGNEISYGGYLDNIKYNNYDKIEFDFSIDEIKIKSENLINKDKLFTSTSEPTIASSDNAEYKQNNNIDDLNFIINNLNSNKLQENLYYIDYNFEIKYSINKDYERIIDYNSNNLSFTKFPFSPITKFVQNEQNFLINKAETVSIKKYKKKLKYIEFKLGNIIRIKEFLKKNKEKLKKKILQNKENIQNNIRIWSKNLFENYYNEKEINENDILSLKKLIFLFVKSINYKVYPDGQMFKNKLLFKKKVDKEYLPKLKAYLSDTNLFYKKIDEIFSPYGKKIFDEFIINDKHYVKYKKSKLKSKLIEEKKAEFIKKPFTREETKAIFNYIFFLIKNETKDKNTLRGYEKFRFGLEAMDFNKMIKKYKNDINTNNKYYDFKKKMIKQEKYIPSNEKFEKFLERSDSKGIIYFIRMIEDNNDYQWDFKRMNEIQKNKAKAYKAKKDEERKKKKEYKKRVDKEKKEEQKGKIKFAIDPTNQQAKKEFAETLVKELREKIVFNDLNSYSLKETKKMNKNLDNKINFKSNIKKTWNIGKLDDFVDFFIKKEFNKMKEEIILNKLSENKSKKEFNYNEFNKSNNLIKQFTQKLYSKNRSQIEILNTYEKNNNTKNKKKIINDIDLQLCCNKNLLELLVLLNDEYDTKKNLKYVIKNIITDRIKNNTYFYKNIKENCKDNKFENYKIFNFTKGRFENKRIFKDKKLIEFGNILYLDIIQDYKENNVESDLNDEMVNDEMDFFYDLNLLKFFIKKIHLIYTLNLKLTDLLNILDIDLVKLLKFKELKCCQEINPKDSDYYDDLNKSIEYVFNFISDNVRSLFSTFENNRPKIAYIRGDRIKFLDKSTNSNYKNKQNRFLINKIKASEVYKDNKILYQLIEKNLRDKELLDKLKERGTFKNNDPNNKNEELDMLDKKLEKNLKEEIYNSYKNSEKFSMDEDLYDESEKLDFYNIPDTFFKRNNKFIKQVLIEYIERNKKEKDIIDDDGFQKVSNKKTNPDLIKYVVENFDIIKILKIDDTKLLNIKKKIKEIKEKNIAIGQINKKLKDLNKNNPNINIVESFIKNPKLFDSIEKNGDISKPKTNLFIEIIKNFNYNYKIKFLNEANMKINYKKKEENIDVKFLIKFDNKPIIINNISDWKKIYNQFKAINEIIKNLERRKKKILKNIYKNNEKNVKQNIKIETENKKNFIENQIESINNLLSKYFDDITMDEKLKFFKDAQKLYKKLEKSKITNLEKYEKFVIYKDIERKETLLDEFKILFEEKFQGSYERIKMDIGNEKLINYIKEYINKKINDIFNNDINYVKSKKLEYFLRVYKKEIIKFIGDAKVYENNIFYKGLDDKKDEKNIRDDLMNKNILCYNKIFKLLSSDIYNIETNSFNENESVIFKLIKNMIDCVKIEDNNIVLDFNNFDKQENGESIYKNICLISILESIRDYFNNRNNDLITNKNLKVFDLKINQSDKKNKEKLRFEKYMLSLRKDNQNKYYYDPNFMNVFETDKFNDIKIINMENRSKINYLENYRNELQTNFCKTIENIKKIKIKNNIKFFKVLNKLKYKKKFAKNDISNFNKNEDLVNINCNINKILVKLFSLNNNAYTKYGRSANDINDFLVGRKIKNKNIVKKLNDTFLKIIDGNTKLLNNELIQKNIDNYIKECIKEKFDNDKDVIDYLNIKINIDEEKFFNDCISEFILNNKISKKTAGMTFLGYSQGGNILEVYNKLNKKLKKNNKIIKNNYVKKYLNNRKVFKNIRKERLENLNLKEQGEFNKLDNKIRELILELEKVLKSINFDDLKKEFKNFEQKIKNNFYLDDMVYNTEKDFNIAKESKELEKRKNKVIELKEKREKELKRKKLEEKNYRKKRIKYLNKNNILLSNLINLNSSKLEIKYLVGGSKKDGKCTFSDKNKYLLYEYLLKNIRNLIGFYLRELNETFLLIPIIETKTNEIVNDNREKLLIEKIGYKNDFKPLCDKIKDINKIYNNIPLIETDRQVVGNQRNNNIPLIETARQVVGNQRNKEMDERFQRNDSGGVVESKT